MAALLTSIGSLVTAVMGWMGNVATAIAGFTEGVPNNPVLLLFCVAVPLCGLGVGMFKRLLSARG